VPGNLVAVTRADKDADQKANQKLRDIQLSFGSTSFQPM
jgi:hypothetical protein